MTSTPISVNQTGLITLEMKAFVHRANNNFFSSALFQDPNTHEGYVRIGHLYHDYYGDYGFGFWSCKAPYEYELTTDVWDEWFTEVLTYDPSTGYSTYSINGATGESAARQHPIPVEAGTPIRRKPAP